MTVAWTEAVSNMLQGEPNHVRSQPPRRFSITISLPLLDG